jgi:hypothetical protein
MGNLQTVSSPRYGRRHVWIAAAVMAIGVCLLVLPPLAEAGSYHDFLCRIPYGPSGVIGRPAPAEDVTYATDGSFFNAGDGCEGGGAMYARMLGGVAHPYGTSASNTFTAPAGLTISGFTIWRYEADGPYVPYGVPASNLLYSPGPPSVQGLCAQPPEFKDCTHRGTEGNRLAQENEVSVPHRSGVTQIQWTASCGGGEGGTCPESGTEYSSQYEVYAADIDLVDNTPPSVSGVSGPLVAGGTLSGSPKVSFNASDGQSGVYSGSLVVDEHTVVSQILNTNGGACQSLNVTNDGQRSFEHAQPCPPSVSGTLTLNTSTLAAGQHSLELVVDDAAGNQTVAYNGTITVAGSSAGGSKAGSAAGSAGGVVIGPGSPAATRGALNGTNASDQAKLTARWTRTSKAAFTSRYGVRQRVTGRLTTTAGLPISGALIDIYETPGFQGAQAHLSDTGVRTSSTGTWTLVLPGDVSSCALRLAYRSHVNDTVAAASAALRLSVQAGLKLDIAPHITSVGRSIYFDGVLHGTPIPSGGKQLVLEASSDRGWIQFDTISTDARGRYKASYRFKFPGPVTYRFRVLCPHEADFPFQKGTSNVVDVHER